MIPDIVTAYCHSQTLEMTPIRQVLLEHLWEHRAPTKAYDMIEVLREKALARPNRPPFTAPLIFWKRKGSCIKFTPSMPIFLATTQVNTRRVSS